MTGPDLDRIRTSYDRVAQDYARRFGDELAGKPLDRALLAAFAELVRATGVLAVADVGCGPGHVTAHLAGLGLDARGVDLSPGMVARARADHPGLRFDVGSMTALPLPDGALGGIVALYSIIHLPTDALPAVFAGFRRVLRPGAPLLLAFQTGDEVRHVTDWWGHPVDLDGHRRPADLVARLLADAGLAVRARLVRQPEREESAERAYLLAAATDAG